MTDVEKIACLKAALKEARKEILGWADECHGYTEADMLESLVGIYAALNL